MDIYTSKCKYGGVCVCANMCLYTNNRVTIYQIMSTILNNISDFRNANTLITNEKSPVALNLQFNRKENIKM